ncbi:MAG TPA: cyclic nucleotide-binding domain-containing protein [Candidatus Eremiobacteraeota bacterium]|nr:MAG: DNA-binding transcriptional dual regulator Crp [bacterium ADurb.Bin363]HPZ06623.1 cyclic nucleotide-binding domain-containing protein [Candidatus Eremiobacteraeota bacterium]
MDTSKIEYENKYKTGNYLVLEEACKRIISEEISEEEFLEKLDYIRGLIKECESEYNEVIEPEDIDSEEFQDTKELYLEAVDIYEEAITDLEEYLSERNEKLIQRGLKMALKANKLLLQVQEIAEEKEKNFKELEKTYKSYRLDSGKISHIFSIAQSYIVSSPSKEFQLKENLEKAGNKSEIIKLIPLFNVLGEKNLERIESRIKLRRYQGNTILFNEGEPANELYIIKSGEITIFKDFPHRNLKRTIATLTKGDLFGDMGILLESPRTLSASISSDTAELYIISKIDFLYILRTYPDVNIKLSRILCQRIKETNGRLMDYLADYIE